jgi:hypothetical protein
MWQSSESIKELSPALVAALGALTEIKKGREAKVQMKSGGNYGYKYADLADTIQTVRPILAKHGLVVMQNACTNNPEFVLISTTILHTSGEWLRFEPLALPSGRTAQETGSAISYGRRYHLQACLGLATEDDDGASAGQRTSAPRTRQTPSSGTTTPPKAPSAPRTPEERAIREILSELPNGLAAGIKQGFVAKYGTLADLDPSQHPDALAWVEDKVRTDD